jgi:TolA-binding protein
MNRSILQRTIPLLITVATCCFVGGCATTTPARDTDETFFAPIASIERQTTAGPDKQLDSEQSAWIARADSLQRILDEQARRVDSLVQQVRILQSSQVSAQAAVTPPQKVQVSRSAGSGPTDRPTPSISYDAALQVYESGKYQQAIRAFQDLVRQGIDRDLEDNCRLWIGVSYFNLRRFDRAAAAFKQVVGWRGSDKRGDALFMLGQTYEQVGDRRQAKTAFEALLKEFPTSELVPAARRKLEVLGSTK